MDVEDGSGNEWFSNYLNAAIILIIMQRNYLQISCSN
jgi:hypothetical protein